MGSLLLKKKLQPQELNSEPLGRSLMSKNLQFPPAPCCTVLPISPCYHMTPKLSISFCRCSIWASTMYFSSSSSTTTTTILHNAYPPSHHCHPYFTTTVTITNGHHSHLSPMPTITTASMTSATSQQNEKGGDIFRCQIAESDMATK